jgi:hypothetical protein
MKKLFASFFALLGVGVAAQTGQPSMIDPKSVLFSLSTIAGDLPETLSVSEALRSQRFLINEDDWAQIEFLPKTKFDDVKRLLTELREFENANRVGNGWRNVYVRKFARSPVVEGEKALTQIVSTAGGKRGNAPLLTSSTSIVGEVKQGFTVSLGGNVNLYGYSSRSGIGLLAASVGENPSDINLTNAFIKLNQKYSIILVDWRSKLILSEVTANGQVGFWRP